MSFRLTCEPTKETREHNGIVCRVWALQLPSGRQMKMLVPWVLGDLPEVLELQTLIDAVRFEASNPGVIEAIRNGSFSR
jgi:hypothetical protein